MINIRRSCRPVVAFDFLRLCQGTSIGAATEPSPAAIEVLDIRTLKSRAILVRNPATLNPNASPLLKLAPASTLQSNRWRKIPSRRRRKQRPGQRERGKNVAKSNHESNL